jgi:hypothetical protein
VQDLIIQPQEGKKGRSFRATCVTTVIANGIFPEGGGGATIRPVWAMFAGSESELRPFAANLKLGRKAEKDINRFSRRGGDSERYEFLKSVGYHMAWQREPEGTLVTLFHPELFRLDPGMVDPGSISFVMLVPQEWASAQTVDIEAPVRHAKRMKTKEFKGCPLSDAELTAMVPTAYLFAAYLDRRTRCPLIADGRFYLQVLLAALTQGMVSRPGNNLTYTYHREEWGYKSDHGFQADGLESVGILHALAAKASHADFEAFLAYQVSLFFDYAGDFVSVAQRVDLSDFEAVL